MKKTMLMLTLLILVACGPSRVGNNPSPIQQEEQILLLDRAHKPYLKVVQLQSRRMDSGQLEVIMDMQNKRNKDLWTDIQVVFQDADGVEVDKTNWEPVLFHRREMTTFKKVSLTPKAQAYRIVIRKAKTAR